MDKTRPTYRDTIREIRSDWRPYRKWLRRRQRPAYDDMWTLAEDLSDAAGEANPRDPMKGILLSICHGQQMKINELQRRLDDLEEG